MDKVTEALSAAYDTKAMFVGHGVINRLGEMFVQQFPGKEAVVVTDFVAYEIVGRRVDESLRAAGIKTKEPYIFTQKGMGAEYVHVQELAEALKEHDAIPVAVGSGVISDLTKLASHVAGRHYMMVATAASMDGYTAFGASITSDGMKHTIACPAPQAVVADIDVISHAPVSTSAAGYADLFAKITAGADWIIADQLGEVKIDRVAWEIVQGDLLSAISNPKGVPAGDATTMKKLMEGLLLGGFAMQKARSSRPASGAEHLFSHLWEMQHHTCNGRHISHGFQVAIGTLASTAMYEQALATDFSQLDVDYCCSRWPSHDETLDTVESMLAGTDFLVIAMRESDAKYVPVERLRTQLHHLKDNWPQIRAQLRQQLVPLQKVRQMLAEAGAPVEPEQIGISRWHLRESFVLAQYIRDRFTILDLAVRTQCMDRWLDAIFGPGAMWQV